MQAIEIKRNRTGSVFRTRHQLTHGFGEAASLAAELKLRKSWAAQETEELEALRSGRFKNSRYIISSFLHWPRILVQIFSLLHLVFYFFSLLGVSLRIGSCFVVSLVSLSTLFLVVTSEVEDLRAKLEEAWCESASLALCLPDFHRFALCPITNYRQQNSSSNRPGRTAALKSRCCN